MRQCPYSVFTSQLKATAECLKRLLGWKSQRARTAWQSIHHTEAPLSILTLKHSFLHVDLPAFCLLAGRLPFLSASIPSKCGPGFGPDPRHTGRLSLAPVNVWSSPFERKGWQKGHAESYEMLVHVLFELNGAQCSEMFMYKCRVEKEKEKKQKELLSQEKEGRGT